MHVVVERFLGSSDGKQRQSGGIEDNDDRSGNHLHKAMQEENNRAAGEGRERVTPIAQRLGWNGADQQVANDSARQGGGKGQHHETEEIEAAA